MLGYDVNNTKGRIVGDSIRENRERTWGLVGLGKGKILQAVLRQGERSFDDHSRYQMILDSSKISPYLSDRHIRRMTSLYAYWCMD